MEPLQAGTHARPAQVAPAQFTQHRSQLQTHKPDRPRDPRLQQAKTPHITAHTAPITEETGDDKRVRWNRDITALVNRRRHPNSRYPPYLKGVGSYTHVQVPPREHGSGPTIEFLPLGLGERPLRSSRSSHKLVTPVKEPYDQLKRILQAEEKVDQAADQSHVRTPTPLTLLTIPDRSPPTHEERDEDGDTEMGGTIKANVPEVDSAIGTPSDWSRKSSTISLPPQAETTTAKPVSKLPPLPTPTTVAPLSNVPFVASPDVTKAHEWAPRISSPLQSQSVSARQAPSAPVTPTSYRALYDPNRDPRRGKGR